MSVISKWLGDATLGGVKGVFEGLGTLAKDIRSAITGDISPEKRAELESKAAELEMLTKQGQLEINKQEAQHPSMFVSGARPAIMWVCGISLAAYFIPKHILAAILWSRVSWHAISLYVAGSAEASGLDPAGIMEVLPPYPISAEGLLELTGGMLGLTLWRTLEKRKGVARN